MKITQLSAFVIAGKKYLAMFNGEKSILSFAIEKTIPRAEMEINSAKKELIEDISFERIKYASRETGTGNVIENKMQIGKNIITQYHYTDENKQALKEEVRRLNNDFYEREVKNFKTHICEIPSSLPIEFLEPFYDIVINRLNEEDEYQHYLNLK